MVAAAEETDEAVDGDVPIDVKVLDGDLKVRKREVQEREQEEEEPTPVHLHMTKRKGGRVYKLLQLAVIQ